MNSSLQSALKDVLQEAFDGTKTNGSCFVSSQPDTGIFGTLDGLSAERASTPVNGVTMAAHADHTRYYLWVINEMFAGKSPEKDWEESWKIGEVDEPRWREIRAHLKEEYERTLQNIETVETDEQYDLFI
ncbi:MAG TPA: hypothetical protein VFK37_09745, partial [Bacillales bacterium]|nr:hypothetical protein [Bacillales bacterium]